MSLEEEIRINQFGQGVYSVDDLLDLFSQLDDDKKRQSFVHFYCQVCESNLTDSDVEQALADCSIDATDATYGYLNLSRLATGLKGVISIPHTANPPEGTLEKPYKLLLHLFKIDYQRRYALEKDNPTKWWYWDLSSSETAQGILTRHRELVDEVYNTPSFRSEFVSIAKWWNSSLPLQQIFAHEAAPETQTHFDFITYDEMSTNTMIGNKHSLGIALLRHSLAKALSIRYKLDDDQARRLTLGVVERHLQETYNRGLC